LAEIQNVSTLKNLTAFNNFQHPKFVLIKNFNTKNPNKKLPSQNLSLRQNRKQLRISKQQKTPKISPQLKNHISTSFLRH
jgi:hypothetical protein